MVTGSPNGRHPPEPDARYRPVGGPARQRGDRYGDPHRRRHRPTHRGMLLLARTALSLGTLALALAVLHGDRGLLGPGPAAAPRAVPVAPAGSLPAPAVGLGTRPPSSAPVELSIPVIGLRSRLARLDADPDGSLHPPTDPDTAGWYGGGPLPGDAGSPPALIVGRAGSPAGRGVFARLGELRAGNSVLVRRGDGSTAAFDVYRVARYPGPGLPAGRVYAVRPRAELRLVTCPEPGSGTGGVVVYAALRHPGPTNPPPAAPAPTTR
ncbi:MAG TPA: class F sortase [Mycobacteriales bacterium]|nr:class F sortase [Mycobacteriales bacterium]